MLDQVYSDSVLAFEEQLCQPTDVTRRQWSGRGGPPRIRWVESSRRAARQLKSWQTMDRPLVWMTNWVQHVLRFIAAVDEDTSAPFLAQDLEDCPAEFKRIPALIGLMKRAQTLIKAMEPDECSQLSCRELNETALERFLQEVGQALDEERRHVQQCHLRSWKEWVREAQSSHKGWAHKWTALKEHWRPVRVAASSRFMGRSRDALQSEKDRLSSVSGCSEEQEHWFQADVGCYRELPDVAIEEFLRAARSFPCRIASSWGGFHPATMACSLESRRGWRSNYFVSTRG